MPIMLAHRLTARARRAAASDGDAAVAPARRQVQVTVEYEGDRPVARRHRGRLDAARRRTSRTRNASARRSSRDVIEAVDPEGAARPQDDQVSTSTRPAASSSAARRATPASPAARSSSTPTAAWAATAAAPSAARIPSKVDRSACLRRPLGGQEHRRRRAGAALRGAGGLRHRRGRAGVGHGRHLRHRRPWPEAQIMQRGARGVRPHAHAASSRRSSCASRSTAPRRRTAISAARRASGFGKRASTLCSRGSAPTGRRTQARRARLIRPVRRRATPPAGVDVA